MPALLSGDKIFMESSVLSNSLEILCFFKKFLGKISPLLNVYLAPNGTFLIFI